MFVRLFGVLIYGKESQYSNTTPIAGEPVYEDIFVEFVWIRADGNSKLSPKWY